MALLLCPLLIVTSMADLRVTTAPGPNSDPASMWLFEARTSHIGSTWTDEYVPWWVTLNLRSIPRPAEFSSEVGRTLPPLSMQLVDAGYTTRRYEIKSDAPAQLSLHQFYLPQWRVKLNGRPLSTYPSGPLGLLTFDVPATESGGLEVDFDSTAAERAGIALSLAAGVILLVVARGRWLLVAGPLALLTFTALLLRGTPTLPSQPAGVTVGDTAVLVAIRAESDSVRPGEPFRLTLTWLALQDGIEDLKVFVHITDAQSGRLLAQADGNPVGGFSSTTRWRAGEIIEDVRTVPIPANAAPGEYEVYVGMYRLDPLENLPAIQYGQPLPEARIPAGDVRIVAR
jgi:hypothetical protein